MLMSVIVQIHVLRKMVRDRSFTSFFDFMVICQNMLLTNGNTEEQPIKKNKMLSSHLSPFLLDLVMKPSHFLSPFKTDKLRFLIKNL